MGEVYLAQDTRLDRPVALKLLSPHLAADNKQLRRFLQEAKVAAALHHPNICVIYEVGDTQQQPFIAMEYIEGQTLAVKINQQPLELSALLNFAVQVADAVEEAHSKGIIHRDLKPANVLITSRNQAKVLDFGLAKLTAAAEAVSLSELPTQPKTETGTVMGTVPYMSPEQARGKEVDGRSDLFSFGIVLYEMATGRLPFVGATRTEILDRILNAQPEAVARFNYSAPAELERIIRKCLEKEKERRYQSATELSVDLQNLKRDTDAGRDRGKLTDSQIATMQQASATPTNGVEAIATVGRGGRRNRLFSRVGLGMTIIAMLLIATLAYALLRQRTTLATPTEIKSLVVLPLKNQTGDAQDDFISDGITDELITKLTKLKTVRVVSHSISTRFKNSDKDAAAIGRELAVEAVLDGTVRRSGSRFRLSVHLVNAQDGFELWADDDFEISLNDILDTQRQLAEAVAARLKQQFTPQDRALVAKNNTANAAAYELLLRGKERFNKGEPGIACELFRKAIQLDPNFADAYGWLSLGLNEQFHNGHGNRATLDEAIEQANKALAIDPNLIIARRALITIYRNISQTEEGLKQAKLALATNPDDFDAIVAAALAYWETGLIDKAIQLYQRAISIDPNDDGLRMRLARCYLHSGEYQRGLDVFAPLFAQRQEGDWMWIAMLLYGKLGQFDRAKEMGEWLIENDTGSLGFAGYWDYGRILKQAGKTNEARTVLLKGVQRGEAKVAAIENVRNRIWLGYIYEELGERDQALAQVKRANTLEPNNAWVLYQSGEINARLGNMREAVAYLEQAVAQGFRELQYFTLSLDDKLGNDPEYCAVRAGLQKRIDELRQLY